MENNKGRSSRAAIIIAATAAIGSVLGSVACLWNQYLRAAAAICGDRSIPYRAAWKCTDPASTYRRSNLYKYAAWSTNATTNTDSDTDLFP